MVKKMTENANDKYALYSKSAWAIYILITILAILILVFLVAEDNEERFFYTLMPAAAAYVFRPTEKFMKKQITRVMGPVEGTDNK